MTAHGLCRICGNPLTFYERRKLEIRLLELRRTRPAVMPNLERAILPACDECLLGILRYGEARQQTDEIFDKIARVMDP
jgi:hypothetical protein